MGRSKEQLLLQRVPANKYPISIWSLLSEVKLKITVLLSIANSVTFSACVLYACTVLL